MKCGAPVVDNREALSVEIREIAQALRGGPMPPGTAEEGLEVVRTLEAASQSLSQSGTSIAP